MKRIFPAPTVGAHLQRAARSALAIGLVLVILATLGALTGCGGGDEPTPQLIASGNSDATAGSRAAPSQALAVALNGPTFTLAQAATIDIEATILWDQDILADADLTAWLEIPGVGTTPRTFLAAARYTGATVSQTYKIRATLPAGTWSLSGTGHILATMGGVPRPALTTLRATAAWAVLTVPEGL